MILETNEFFIITDSPQVFEHVGGMSVKLPSEFDGVVFKAVLVEGDYVAAEVVERSPDPSEKPIVFSLNYTRHEIMPVSKHYAKAISDSRKLEFPESTDMTKIFGFDLNDHRDGPPSEEPPEGPDDHLF